MEKRNIELEKMLYKIGMTTEEVEESFADGLKMLEYIARRWDSLSDEDDEEE